MVYDKKPSEYNFETDKYAQELIDKEYEEHKKRLGVIEKAPIPSATAPNEFVSVVGIIIGFIVCIYGAVGPGDGTWFYIGVGVILLNIVFIKMSFIRVDQEMAYKSYQKRVAEEDGKYNDKIEKIKTELNRMKEDYLTEYERLHPMYGFSEKVEAYCKRKGYDSDEFYKQVMELSANHELRHIVMEIIAKTISFFEDCIKKDNKKYSYTFSAFVFDVYHKIYFFIRPSSIKECAAPGAVIRNAELCMDAYEYRDDAYNRKMDELYKKYFDDYLDILKIESRVESVPHKKYFDGVEMAAIFRLLGFFIKIGSNDSGNKIRENREEMSENKEKIVKIRRK